MKFEISSIQVELYVPANQFSQHLETYIIQHLKDKYENNAFEKFGLIHKIISIEKILTHEISNLEGNLYLLLQIQVENYLPKIYDHIQVPIKKILPCGSIFLELQNLKILISNSFSNQFQKQYQINQVENVILTDIRFEKDSFHCLAKFELES